MSNKRILVVEADQQLSNAIYRALRHAFGPVDWVWVGTEELAQKELSRGQFDYIVSDYLLAGLRDGVDLWEYCRKQCPRTPFMMISAVPFEEIFRRIPKGGPTPQLLPKPFQVRELVSCFQSLK
jgi:DNA-binding response OmpR family regulator